MDQEGWRIEFSNEVSKSPFWVEKEEAYDLEYGAGSSALTPGRNFWLKDDWNYDVIENVGRGAFASVWRARERVTGRILAIKRFESAERIDIRSEVRNESRILDVSREGVSLPVNHLMLHSISNWATL